MHEKLYNAVRSGSLPFPCQNASQVIQLTKVYPLCAKIDPTSVFLMLKKRRNQYPRSAIALAEPDQEVLLADIL